MGSYPTYQLYQATTMRHLAGGQVASGRYQVMWVLILKGFSSWFQISGQIDCDISVGSYHTYQLYQATTMRQLAGCQVASGRYQVMWVLILKDFPSWFQISGQNDRVTFRWGVITRINYIRRRQSATWPAARWRVVGTRSCGYSF